MKPLILVSCALLVASPMTRAQSRDDEIARAVLAAPGPMAAAATVVRLADDGSHVVLREGKNGLVCYDRSNEPGRPFAVQCTSVANLPRVAQTHRISMSAGSAEEARATIEAAERNGSRVPPRFGSVWYALTAENEASVRPHQPHITVAVPFATSATTDLPSEGAYNQAGAWIMGAGTSAAHIMIPGR